MVEAYVVNIPCWIQIDQFTGRSPKKLLSCKYYRGTVVEIYFDRQSKPFKYRLIYEKGDIVIMPRVEDGLLISSIAGNRTITVLLDEGEI